MSATSGTECSRTSQASMPDGLTIFSIVIAEAAGAHAEQRQRGKRGGE